MLGVADMFFVSETNLGFDALPAFEGYTTVADSNVKVCSFGGIAWYVKDALAKHLFHVCYNQAYISFRLDLAPQYVFIGVYIQPEEGRYFNVNMFSDVASALVDCWGSYPICWW